MADKVVGNLIVFEGIDGSGTTTAADRLCGHLRGIGRTFMRTAEPTDGPIGRLIRQSALKDCPHALQAESAMHLYVADRYEHIYGSGGVLESSGELDYVVQDRYFFSSIAYQGASVSYEKACELNKGFPYPALLIYFRCPVSVCMRRIERRNGEREIYEREDFLLKAAENYDKIFASLPQASGMLFRSIDSSRSPDEVFGDVLSAFGERF